MFTPPLGRLLNVMFIPSPTETVTVFNPHPSTLHLIWHAANRPAQAENNCKGKYPPTNATLCTKHEIIILVRNELQILKGWKLQEDGHNKGNNTKLGHTPSKSSCFDQILRKLEGFDSDATFVEFLFATRYPQLLKISLNKKWFSRS